MSSKKKTFIIATVVIFFIVGGFLLYKNYSQQEQPEEKAQEQVKELAAGKASCLEEATKMTDEQIVVKTNTFISRSLEGAPETQVNVANYLVCSLDNERKEFDKRIHKELYARMANHINNLISMPPAQKKTYLETGIAEMFYEVGDDGKIIRPLPRENSVLSEIALSPMEKLCPGGKAEPDFLEACLGPAQSSLRRRFCDNICDNLFRYLNDFLEFEKSLANTAWQKELELLESQALGRMAFAYRFGGKDYADKIWNSIPNNEVKEDLKNFPKSLEYINCREFGFDESKACERKIYPACEGLLKKAENSICELEAKSASVQ